MPQETEESIPDESPANTGDVEMGEGAENTEGTDAPQGGQIPEAEPTGEEQAEEEPTENKRTTFISYLTSPIVSLAIGSSEGTTTSLTAHQSLLEQSPYFAEVCKNFADDGSIELPDENIDAVGCFLEFLYTGEYFPRKIPGQRVLEEDPTAPSVDDTGDQLLKHARVYTLADKFNVNTLKRLASSKIHCVNSTAKGEIAYTRYVYAYTSKDDTKVEDEFKTLCLEYPQFGYDVLTRVLDDKLKKERNDKMHPATGSGRKRARHSSGGA